MYSQKRNWAATVPISTFMCLWAIYIFPGSVHIFSCSRIGRLHEGIYKSLTDTWMWKLGLWPRNSIIENICFEFSVLCLCSVQLKCNKGEISSTYQLWVLLELHSWRSFHCWRRPPLHKQLGEKKRRFGMHCKKVQWRTVYMQAGLWIRLN